VQKKEQKGKMEERTNSGRKPGPTTKQGNNPVGKQSRHKKGTRAWSVIGGNFAKIQKKGLGVVEPFEAEWGGTGSSGGQGRHAGRSWGRGAEGTLLKHCYQVQREKYFGGWRSRETSEQKKSPVKKKHR